MLKITLTSEKAMLTFGETMAKHCAEGLVIFLYGNLGAGKTTFTRGLLRGLGCQEPIKSPTYTLVESYEINSLKIFHFDFYRLKNAEELEYIGIQDYFFEKAVCIIEWPDNGKPFLPQPDLFFYIHFKNQTERKVEIKSGTDKGNYILKELTNDHFPQ